MIRRLYKELTVLYPYLLAAVAIQAGGWYYTRRMELYIQLCLAFATIPLQLLIVHIASVLPFGVEFREGVCNRLLSAPISRRRIYWEKTLVLCGVLVLIACVVAWHLRQVCAVLLQVGVSEIERMKGTQEYFYAIYLLFVMGVLFVLFTGPLLSVLLKRAYAALWASAMATFVFYLILFCLNESINGYPKNKVRYEALLNLPSIEPIFHKIGLALPFAVYTIPWCAAAFLLARWRWKNLEV